MKKILQLSFFFLFAAFYSQNISDYAFVSIDGKSGGFEKNKYGLNTLLHLKLTAKKYTVINENSESWPEAAKINPCSVLKAEIADTSNFLKNKLQINFKDCNGKTVGSFEGKSHIKEFDAGFKDALTKASQFFPASNPVKQLALTAKQKTPIQSVSIAAEPLKTTTVPAEINPVKTENTAQTFSNGILNINRIFISESQFILASQNNSTPYAIFKASTKKEVYRVQLQDGTQTLGYLENGNIVIEMQNADESFRKEIFLKK